MGHDKRIDTDRLFLLPSEDERDLELYRSHLTDADEFFLQYGFRLDDEILSIIDFHSTDVCYYTVFLKATGEMVGYIGINPFKESSNIGELEFHIFKEHRLRGYCVEAASAYLASFFEGSITGWEGSLAFAEAMPYNTAACRVLEKLGFHERAKGFRVVLDDEGEIDREASYSVVSYELEANDFLPNRLDVQNAIADLRLSFVT